MSAPTRKYLEKLASQLFPTLEAQQQFISSLSEPDADSRARVRLVTTNSPLTNPPITPPAIPLCNDSRFQFLPDFVCADRVEQSRDLAEIEIDQAPDDTAYLCDLSSAVLASAMTAIPLREVTSMLDLCASPGGKSVFCSLLFRYQWMLANETIQSRTGALISNFSRCKIKRAGVASSDSSFYAQELPEAFEIVIVDAPCSGQSLRAKGVDVKDCFHPIVISRNANRQKRIIANAVQTLSKGGHLTYLTCTFSPEENENVIRWALKKFPELEAVENPSLKKFQSSHATFPCYRVYPWQGFGAGGFSTLLRKSGKGQPLATPPADLRYFWQSFDQA